MKTNPQLKRVQERLTKFHELALRYNAGGMKRKKGEKVELSPELKRADQNAIEEKKKRIATEDKEAFDRQSRNSEIRWKAKEKKDMVFRVGNLVVEVGVPAGEETPLHKICSQGVETTVIGDGDHKRVHFTGKESMMMVKLIRNVGRVLTPAGFLEDLYPPFDQPTPELKIISVFMAKVKRKLAQANASVEVETVYQKGWCLRVIPNSKEESSTVIARLNDFSELMKEEAFGRRGKLVKWAKGRNNDGEMVRKALPAIREKQARLRLKKSMAQLTGFLKKKGFRVNKRKSVEKTKALKPEMFKAGVRVFVYDIKTRSGIAKTGFPSKLRVAFTNHKTFVMFGYQDVTLKGEKETHLLSLNDIIDQLGEKGLNINDKKTQLRVLNVAEYLDPIKDHNDKERRKAKKEADRQARRDRDAEDEAETDRIAQRGGQGAVDEYRDGLDDGGDADGDGFDGF